MLLSLFLLGKPKERTGDSPPGGRIAKMQLGMDENLQVKQQ